MARVSPVEWRFEQGWDATLRELGQTGDIIKRMHAAVTSPDPSRFVIIDESVAMEPIAGVVRAKGLHDELAGQPFMVIEVADGRLCYTKVDLRTAEQVGEGDIVRIGVAATVAAIATGQVQTGGKAKWRPRVSVHRVGPPLRLQQRYKGPAWLDTPEAAAVATSGLALGIDVARARVRRDANLRAMGMPADAQDRASTLDRIEARTLAQQLAATGGLRIADESESSRRSLGDVSPAPVRTALRRRHGRALAAVPRPSRNQRAASARRARSSCHVRQRGTARRYAVAAGQDANPAALRPPARSSPRSVVEARRSEGHSPATAADIARVGIEPLRSLA